MLSRASITLVGVVDFKRAGNIVKPIWHFNILSAWVLLLLLCFVFRHSLLVCILLM